jgi:hypothetical protein
VKKLVLSVFLCLVALVPWALGAPLSKGEKKKLKTAVAMAVQKARTAEALAKSFRKKGEESEANGQEGIAEDNWALISSEDGPLSKLAEANDKKTWKFLIKTAARVPENFGIEVIVRKAAEAMSDPAVQSEIKKSALKSKNPKIRRELVMHMANKKEWGLLVKAIKDKDEGVASIAAWRLIDNRVESAVDPMIAELERLERDKGGIWDVLRDGLGRMLGQRASSAIEYTSMWEIVKEKGGLAAIEPKTEKRPEPGEMSSGVRLFGREIDCTRVVFILDISGSMKQIDPGQRTYDDTDKASRTRKVDGTDGEASKPSKLKTRLQRAQRELKNVLSRLPANFKVNIVVYSSNVKVWRSGEGDKPAGLHVLSSKNRAEAKAFVDEFRADGVTCTDRALMRSFDVEGARCFYLLSDGFATHDGRTPVPTEQILGLIEEFKERHITIHTLGFQGADVQMMEAVADATGGKYSDIK